MTRPTTQAGVQERVRATLFGHRPSAATRLVSFLTRRGIRHQVSDAGITVFEALPLRRSRIDTLPENLTVQGDLDLTNTWIDHLPDTLVVHRHLTLTGCNIVRLPRNFRVGGCLDLRGSGIRTLPPGLVVGAHLVARHTRITHLPEDMLVSGITFPPTSLIDVESFLAGETDDAQLVMPRSWHERLRLQEQLAPYPDLLRCVLSLQPGVGFVVQRDKTGQKSLGVQVSAQWTPPF